MSTRRLPDGCSVEWSKQPARQDRLLDWLQNHPVERQCLFNAKSGRQLSKATCVAMAAQAIFAQDENPANSVAVKKDPKPFAYAIMNLFRTQWRPKYQKVNKAIGRTAARTPYEDFEKDSNAKKVAEIEMVKFPQWAKLHNFWRRLPEFNQFADSKKESSPQNIGRKRKNPPDLEESDELELDSESDGSSHSSPKPVPQPRLHVKAVSPNRAAKRIKRSPMVPTPIKVKTEKDPQDIIDFEDDDDDELHSSRVSTSTTVWLTRNQQFKKDMAELKLRTKEQELKAREQELKALEKKHEAFMALYGPAKF